MTRTPLRSMVSAGLPKGSQITPLVIILSFVLLTEVVVMTGVLGTRDLPQLMLTSFCIGFPIAIAVPFFWLLARKPWVFYAPRDYGSEIDPQKYIAAMSARVTDSTSRLFNNLPEIIERAASRDADLRQIVSQLSHSKANVSADQVLRTFSDTIAQEIAQSEIISVDLAEFGGDEIKVPCSSDLVISDFLNIVFFEIEKTYPLPGFTYGTTWVLEDKSSKKRFFDMGSVWARKNNREIDERPLDAKGLAPGIALKAIKLAK